MRLMRVSDTLMYKNQHGPVFNAFRRKNWEIVLFSHLAANRHAGLGTSHEDETAFHKIQCCEKSQAVGGGIKRG